MTDWVMPIARTGKPGLNTGLQLAGSQYVWFNEVIENADILPAEIGRHSHLTTQRADLSGLSLDRPRIMGILNVTPDSFSDGGQHVSHISAIARAQAMAVDADILDIGGESTRPGAKEVPVEEEIDRTAPVIRAIREAGLTLPISIDTRKAAVAKAALDAGANIVNDVSALEFDAEMAGLVADRDVPICLMHMRGLPANMQNLTQYDHVARDVAKALDARVCAALKAGISRNRLILDPGVGFGKTTKQCVSLLQDLALYHDLGLPLLVGASRKRFIGEIASVDDASNRVSGSVHVAMFAVAQGAHILRVHDTFETRQALDLFIAINEVKT